MHGHGEPLKQKHHVKSFMVILSPSNLSVADHGVPQPQQQLRHFMNPATGVITSFLSA